MRRKTYFIIHKNKKPKKAKYSNPLTKQQKIGIEKCFVYFKEQMKLLKLKIKKNEKI